MQTPKARAGPLEIPQKTSPVTPQRTSSATSRTARQLKTTASESDSPQPANRTPKDRSPNVSERKSPRSPMSERKRPSRISELESQLAQAQEELKKSKDQLVSSESCKQHALEEAEEVKKQLVILAEKHEESKHQLLEHSASEEDRLQELRKISQERDRAWESELEAVQKQHSAESAALASALNEIQRLKIELESVAGSEAVRTKDAESLRVDLAKAHSAIENLRVELESSKQSESQARAMVADTLRQLESAKLTMETLRLDGIKTMEAYNSLSLELGQSRARVNALEELVSNLQMDLAMACRKHSDDGSVDENKSPAVGDRVEFHTMKSELKDLRSALEALETKYQEEQIQSTLKLHTAYELVEKVTSETGPRETKLESELRRTRAQVEDLKANLMDKETELQSISEENEGLSMKIEKALSAQRQPELDSELNNLKASVMDKEAMLQIISDENEMLKSEIKKRESDSKTNGEVAKAGEREALVRLGHATEEAEKNGKRAERATEQLEAAQAANSEMEAELRRLKVQSDQWRKAAEAAAAVLSAGNNVKCVDRSASMDNNYHPVTGKICSPYSEDMDDDSPKKKTVLKKLGSLWKKGQK